MLHRWPCWREPAPSRWASPTSASCVCGGSRTTTCTASPTTRTTWRGSQEEAQVGVERPGFLLVLTFICPHGDSCNEMLRSHRDWKSLDASLLRRSSSFIHSIVDSAQLCFPCWAQVERAAYWEEQAQSSALVQTSAAAFVYLVFSTESLDINLLLVSITWLLYNINNTRNVSAHFAASPAPGNPNSFSEHILGVYKAALCLFLQGLCPVTISTLLCLADMRSTSAPVPCAAMLRTCCLWWRLWRGPTLTCGFFVTPQIF